jgi:hypothetical protein
MDDSSRTVAEVEAAAQSLMDAFGAHQTDE